MNVGINGRTTMHCTGNHEAHFRCYSKEKRMVRPEGLEPPTF